MTCAQCKGNGCDACLDRSPKTTPCAGCRHPMCKALRREARAKEVYWLVESLRAVSTSADVDEFEATLQRLAEMAKEGA